MILDINTNQCEYSSNYDFIRIGNHVTNFVQPMDDADELHESTNDRWAVEPISQQDNPHGVLEESSFRILFPKYREGFFKEIWPYLTKKMSEYNLVAKLDVIEGTVSVSNTKKTWDPFIIIKARDMLKLMARSVPYNKAVRILEDNVFSEVIQVKNLASNTERFIRRRSRLIGNNGTTIQALELLTECYIKVHGGTVTIIGPYKGIKTVRKVVEDTFFNVHPIYNIKALMVKKELLKDEKLNNEDWTRFIPTYKGRHVEQEKPKQKNKKKKKEYTPFPPAPTESKIDKELASGEYFMKSFEKKISKELKRKGVQKSKIEKKNAERSKRYQPPCSRVEVLANIERDNNLSSDFK